MAWGEWQPAGEFWASGVETVARWAASGTTVGSNTARNFAMEPGGPSQNVRGIVRVIVQAETIDDPNTRFMWAGQQIGRGFVHNINDAAALPVPTLPPGATHYEYESNAGHFDGGARLTVSGLFQVSPGAHFEPRLYVRTNLTPDTLLGANYSANAGLSAPELWKGSIAPASSYIEGTVGPDVVDLTDRVGPDGSIVITSTVSIVSWTPPSGSITDYYRGLEADLSTSVEYRILTPRFRFYYEDEPPPPPPLPALGVLKIKVDGDPEAGTPSVWLYV